MTKKTMKWKEIVSNSKKIKENVEKKQEQTTIKGWSRAEILLILSNAVKHPGRDVTIETPLSNCKDCKGTNIYQNLKKSQYLDVADRIITWFKTNVRGPNYVIWGKERISPRLAAFCLSKIIVYYDDHKQMPNTCWFANAVWNTKQTSKNGKTAIIQKATGVKITDYKTLYAAMYEFGYDYYYEDVQTFEETIRRMRGNCVDLNQVEYASLVEMYGKDNVRIVRGIVQCSDGQFGHVWCQIKVGGKWINVDASASAKGKGIGTVICASVISITNINPAWAVNDTGEA